ncbi:MAG: DUF4136 domain-containing protein [Acidobacteriota bacterium]
MVFHWQLVRAVVVATCALVAAPAIALEVRVEHDESFDFTAVGTFGWLDDTAIPGRALPENAALIREEVSRALTKRGLRRQDDDPDLRLVYYVGLQEHVPLAPPGEATPDAPAGTYEEGTLILEFFGRDGERPVWRAAAEDPLDRDRLRRQIRKVVSRMLKQFPPS